MLTHKDLKDFFKDSPSDNIKLLVDFFTEDDLNFAFRMANNEADYCPPISNADHNSIPDYIMIMGYASWALQMKINNLAVNSSPGVSENGVSLEIGSEIRVLTVLKDTFKQNFTQGVTSFKIAYNNRESYGMINSPYGRR